MIRGMFDSLLDLVFDVCTLYTRKRGPLVTNAMVQGDHLRLTLENQGKRELAFAAVEGRDARNARQFPMADLAARAVLAPGEPRLVRLDLAELRRLDVRRLAVLDTTGHAWPVTGFEAGSPAGS